MEVTHGFVMNKIFVRLMITQENENEIDKEIGEMEYRN